jgi:hypothetical protein
VLSRARRRTRFSVFDADFLRGSCSEVGLGVRETSLESSICAHAILQPGLFIVPDTTLDHRFCDNALVVGDPRFTLLCGRAFGDVGRLSARHGLRARLQASRA